MKKQNINNYFNILKGIFYFCLSSFFATLVTILMKKAMKSYNISETNGIFWKSLFSFVFALPLMINNKFSFWKKNLLGINFVRNFIFLILTYFWYYGVMIIPVNHAVILNQATPIFAIIMANVFLKEKTSKKTWFVLLICIAASMLIVRPGSSKRTNFIYLGYCAIFVSILMKASVSIYTKKLSKIQDIFATSYYYAIFTFFSCIPFTIVMEPNLIQKTNLKAMPYLIISGILYIFRTLTWAKSLHYCSVSITQPFDFSRIIFVAIISYFMLHEVTDLRTIFAGIVIFSSYLYLILDKKIK